MKPDVTLFAYQEHRWVKREHQVRDLGEAAQQCQHPIRIWYLTRLKLCKTDGMKGKAALPTGSP